MSCRRVVNWHLKVVFPFDALIIVNVVNVVPGTNKDAGILPQSLALIFNSLQGQLHPTPDLKPLLSNEVIWLDSKQVRQEEIKKLSLLIGGLQEVKYS